MALLSLLCALACAAVTIRRRVVWRMGPLGPALAPAFLLIVWLLFLSAGQAAGSLEAMGWCAAAPLALIAALSCRTSRRRRRDPFPWTTLDRCLAAAICVLLFAFVGHDIPGHYAMIGTYLRGNIPPRAFNDPTLPLGYHLLFDMAAALLTRALAVSPQTALDLASAGCLLLCMACLQGLSRVLFGTPRAQQAARVFFLCGFGPVYLRLFQGGAQFAPHHFLHGQTTQSFMEAILRRPMSLNFVLFLFVLTAALPRLPSAKPGTLDASAAPHPLWLLPCAFVIPQASEELVFFAALPIIWLCLSRRLAWRWGLLWGLVLLAALTLSGVLKSMLFPGGRHLVPEVGLAWPPRLPHSDFWKEGVPLFSAEAAWSLLLEWGPLFLGGLLLSLREERRRVIAAVFGLGFLLACSLSLKRWDHADLDRLLFYGTCSGFMLAASWVEWLEAFQGGRFARVAVPAAALCLVLGPLGYLSFHTMRRGMGIPYARLPEPMPADLRSFFSVVGPREMVLTDAAHAQWLLGYGFLVKAPMTGSMIGKVEPYEVQGYLKSRPDPPADWVFLPSRDPLLAGRPQTARYQDYVLARFTR